MAKPGKRFRTAREGINPDKAYPIAEAVKMVKDRAKAKFDETIEIAMNLGVDPKHADQMVRGVVLLPNGTGRSVRVGVFARGPKADEAKAAGADVVGAEDLVEKVNGGQIDFDRCIATPDMMPRGPSTLPSRPTSGIRSGVAMQRSKSISPLFTFSTRSSAPTTSAPAALASSALAPRANTPTRTVRPEPFGRLTTPRTI